MRTLSAYLIFAIASAAAGAQEAGQPAKPSTKMEAFQASTGVVIVRGYTTVGTLHGLGGEVTVDAREFRDASNQSRRVTGISISVKETARLERENTSFIDSDEIEGLLTGIDYISRVDKSVTTLANYEVEYRTKGDFALTVFNDNRGELSLAVSSGRIGKTNAYLKAAQLVELKQLISAARSKL